MAWERIEILEPAYEIEDDNGNAVVEVAEGTPVVPMGDGYAFQRITYTKGNCRLVFEVRNGLPGCVSAEFTSKGSFIRPKDLAAIRLDDIRADVYGLTGVTKAADGRFVHRMNFDRDSKRVDQIKTRRKLTPEFLAEVATVVREAPEGGRIDAVRAAFGVSLRQALRYMAQAKKHGLIDDNA